MIDLKRVINKNIQCMKSFGPVVWYRRFLYEYIFRKEGIKRSKAEHNFYQACKSWLSKKYQYIINDYKDCSCKSELIGNNIWVFWWQEFDKAPEVVKLCNEQLAKNFTGYNINCITKNNYTDYVEIPDYIIRKLENKQITITHFSDILRMALLVKYGGIWMDATLFSVSEPQNVSDFGFYTIKHNFGNDIHVCKGLWSGFFMAAGKDNRLIEFCYRFFCEYWKDNDALIGYLLIDCIIALGYENILSFKEMIDSVPANNTGVFDLARSINQPVNIDEIERLFKDNQLFKLSWKYNYYKETEGKMTTWGYLLSKR